MTANIAASIILAGVLVSHAASAQGVVGGETEECPPAFRGARVAATPIKEGVTIEFRNPNRASVGEMRGQLREVATLLEQRSMETQSVGLDDDAVDFPPVDISVKDIGNGARVTVRAARSRDIPVLRELASGLVEFWKTSPCAQQLET